MDWSEGLRLLVLKTTGFLSLTLKSCWTDLFGINPTGAGSLRKHTLNFFSSFCNIFERLIAFYGSGVYRRLAWSAALHLVFCITAVAVLSFLSRSSIMYLSPAILFLELVGFASVFGLSPACKYIHRENPSIRPRLISTWQ